MKKPIFGVLLGFAFTLIACGALSTPPGSCQANTSRLMPSNRVPEGSRLKHAAYAGNVNEGIDFSHSGYRTCLYEDLLTHYTDQTKGGSQ